MKYIPDLIPKDKRVLPEYFNVSKTINNKKANLTIRIINYVFTFLFIIAAIGSIDHPVLSVFFAALAFISSPFGHKWLERKLNFKFTLGIKSGACIILIIMSSLLANHYERIDKQEEIAQKKEEQRKEAENIALKKKDQQRKDSLSYYLEKAVKNKENKAVAMLYLQRASLFSTTDSDKIQQAGVRKDVAIFHIHQLIKKRSYKSALKELAPIMSIETNSAELYYNRAQCFYGIGKIKDAVADLTTSRTIGYKMAESFYEKINPIRRRVAYYVTRCCDGSTSSATGRGACSWHGGVCNWNDPVFEEYRKY